MHYNSPREIALKFAEAGMKKSKLSFTQFATIAILGGAFIAFGGLLSVMVAGGMPGIGTENPGLIKCIAGSLFPIGLIMVSVTGADLFTSDCTAFTLPLLQKKLPVMSFLKLLAYSYIFNFVGAQLVAYLFSSGIGSFSQDPWQSYLHHYAAAKVNQDFLTVFIKGIGANWLVCLGMWMGYASKDIIGKCIGIWIPVMLFVTLGYEHSIANMFFMPAAIYSGADILWSDFIIHNLIPATLGNLIGGAVLVGCVYWYLYLKD
ncbi:formate/nitrite transporter family protein [Parabacteroides sp. 52]|uniref:formate/nitrite transporter family protein n=1 Tax=unclassified Parabacteroides TaxID=2649774 RepID=UPI0013D22738|nr:MULTISPECIES: formate/nitrite transporter family protein [unclassified Parabacteroides]MDH6533392.1 formate/nitrite transporter [Parabacteroides sp. PM5-20]NDV54150.1 formate/nitrite transporter family protein [Parabacteroides sp. 52]